MEGKSYNIHQGVIERCKKGDRKAQYELFDLYHRAMYNTALRIVGDEEGAKDVLQESFVSAFKNLNQYREDASFGAWLKRIVINKSITYNKRNNVMEELTEDKEDYYYEWEDVSETALEIEKVKAAIVELPSGFRSVLTLYLFEGYDHKEISQILGISESTSKSQYNRAKKKVREIVNKAVKYG